MSSPITIATKKDMPLASIDLSSILLSLETAIEYGGEGPFIVWVECLWTGPASRRPESTHDKAYVVHDIPLMLAMIEQAVIWRQEVFNNRPSDQIEPVSTWSECITEYWYNVFIQQDHLAFHHVAREIVKWERWP